MQDSFTIVPDNQIDQPLDPALLTDGHPGYPDEIAAEDKDPGVLEMVCGAATMDFPESWYIENESELLDRCRENDKNHTWGMNFLDRFTNQTPTHECTCHSLRANFEAARNKQLSIIYPDGPKAGQRYDDSKRGSVWVSPLSVYAKANPRQWGGANVRHVLEIAMARGILPETIQPFDYKFAAALHGTTGKGGKNQASGPWVAERNFPPGWLEVAKWFMPKRVIFPKSFEQAKALVVRGHLVSVGRNGHAVPWAMYNPVSKVFPYPDSYDVIRADSERLARNSWQGSFSIISVTAADDWMRPAGV
jgi:hypothetical protein